MRQIPVECKPQLNLERLFNRTSTSFHPTIRGCSENADMSLTLELFTHIGSPPHLLDERNFEPNSSSVWRSSVAVEAWPLFHSLRHLGHTNGWTAPIEYCCSSCFSKAIVSKVCTQLFDSVNAQTWKHHVSLKDMYQNLILCNLSTFGPESLE